MLGTRRREVNERARRGSDQVLAGAPPRVDPVLVEPDDFLIFKSFRR